MWYTHAHFDHIGGAGAIADAKSVESTPAPFAEGMRTLRQDGILKVLQGVTTLAEVHATSNN